MKATVLQENLSHGLSIVARAVSKNSALPILDNILISTDKGRLKLSATNLALSITVWIDGQVTKEGQTTVPARTFTDLIGTMSGRIDLSILKSETLKVKDDKSDGKVKGINASDFPPLRTIQDSADRVTVNGLDLKSMIQQVSFAASTDDARPILQGILVEAVDNNLTLTAVDGLRLASANSKLEIPVSTPIAVVLPAKNMKELGRIVGDGDLKMSLIPGGVVFDGIDIEVAMQVIDGKFPDYKSIFPKDTKIRCTVSTDSFLTACKQANVFARDGSMLAKVSVLPGNGENGSGTDQLEISGSSNETGATKTTIEAAITGEPLVIGANVQYLKDALTAIHTANTVLELNDATKGFILRPAADNDGFAQMIMPMAVRA